MVLVISIFSLFSARALVVFLMYSAQLSANLKQLKCILNLLHMEGKEQGMFKKKKKSHNGHNSQKNGHSFCGTGWTPTSHLKNRDVMFQPACPRCVNVKIVEANT